MATIDENGFKLKTQNEYFQDEVALYRDIDPQFNLDPSTPDGLKIAHDAEVFGALDQILYEAYSSKDPQSAIGIDLDIIAFINNVIRNQGSRSTVALKLTGVPGTIIDRGTRVSSRTTGARWVTEQGVTIDANGQIEVNAYSESVGMIEATTGTLTQIVDTVGGWTGVTNEEPAIVGREQETDAELRLRRAAQVGKSGASQVDALLGSIYGVRDVRRVKVYENDTATTDAIGLPGHSVCILVDGGLDEDIAQAIYDKRNPGTFQFQEDTTTAVDVDVTSKEFPENTQKIRFARPDYVDVSMTIVVHNDGSLPSNVADLIKEAIMDFTSGELVPSQYGFKKAGFAIGESVPVSTMMTPVNKVIGSYGGSYIQSLTITNEVDGVLEISPFQLSRFSTENIAVNIS